MAGGDLVPALQEAGFEPVETDLPGGWATDSERTVIVHTDALVRGSRFDHSHRVWVFDAPAADVDTDSDLLARTKDSSSELAIRRALDHADEERGNDE